MLEVAGQKLQQRPVQVGLGHLRLQFDRPLVAGQGFGSIRPWSWKAVPRVLWASARPGFNSSARPVAGDRFVRLPLFAAGRCPGCCGLRQSPASIPIARW